MIRSTVHSDGSADFTFSSGSVDHKFSATPDDGDAIIEYEETQLERGTIRVSYPNEDVWKELMQSDQVTAYLERSDLSSIRRAKGL
jgi:hypothetical protein